MGLYPLGWVLMALAHVLVHRNLRIKFSWTFGTRVRFVLLFLVKPKFCDRCKLLEALWAREVVSHLEMLDPSLFR